ncbi:hypothetical protein BCR36DRAFT_353571 [Piromyces finnis]|uniref:alpha-galactosidase n=1 Tax=Piromyces finnis TaxID=1754191 RepID=A0A1Y1V7F5_9FUNG|nr:hypothetical protein BCR36DRAFT_353571 [Piromyces finnis]|eukprot:ORX49216.1 hypothetical protein BCR36DRAFT_353571 [Piromyces finnis]
MKFFSSASLLSLALLASSVTARWKATPGLTWDYLLGASYQVIEESDKDVVTINVSLAEKYASYFHNKGQRVVCYFSGGTTENRDDKEDYEKAGLVLKGGNDDGWGNNWLDVKNKAKLQPLIRRRLQKAYNSGCDAVEVDCLDIYHYRPEYTKEDTFVFAKWVAETAHEENISIGLKNLSSLVPRLEPYYDFAIVESCSAYTNECNYFKQFTDNNKAVFVVHYGNLGYKLSGSILNQLIREQSGKRFSCVISDHQYLRNHCTNYNCDTGAVIVGRSKSTTTTKKTTTTTKKTTTTTKKTTTTTKKTTTTTKKATSTSAPNTSGKCGPGIGSCVTGCCSKYGYCGTNSDYCGAGCQIGYGDCRCGNVSSNGKTINYGSCPSGYCCSQKGYCGTTISYCGNSCQSEFGTCRCGNITVSGKVYNYGKCSSGYCCSQKGYCGKTSSFCGANCQSSFGKCN